MDAPDFKHITVKRKDDAAIVRFRYTRRHEYGDEKALQAELEKVAGDAGSLLLNLDALEHISSRFVGMLIALSKQCSDEDRWLALCRIRPEPLRVLRLCKADTLIHIYPSEEEARAALGIAGG